MAKFTNNANIPFVAGAWLTLDEYDYNPDENTISATTLIKPLRQIILTSRVPPEEESTVDISDMLTSQLGNAVHNEIERFWRDPRNVIPAAKRLGLPLKRAKRIAVNAPDEWYQQNPDAVPVFIEKRKEKVVNGMTVTGKSDIIWDGEVMDHKVTTVFTYTMGLNHDYYSQQGSIYKWLNPEKVTSDHTTIIHYFRDYRGFEAKQQPYKYPSSPVLPTRFPLASVEETQEYVEWKVDQIFKLRDAPDEKLPECDAEDLWMDEPVWKYWKDPKKFEEGGRCTRVFDNSAEAKKRKAADKNVGVIHKIEGKAKACNYCAARPICKQYKRLKEKDLIA